MSTVLIVLTAYVAIGYVVKVLLLVADAKLIDEVTFESGTEFMIALWPLAIAVFISSFFDNYDFDARRKNRKQTAFSKISAESVAKRIVEGKPKVVIIEGNGENDG